MKKQSRRNSTGPKLAIVPLFTLACATASAAEISTHVLDLQSGVGGANVPVVLMKKTTDENWTILGNEKTSKNGRIKHFGNATNFSTGTYKLVFDMENYPADGVEPFFPEISIVFNVTDADAHYHVPVVISPFGYSTYRGN